MSVVDVALSPIQKDPLGSKIHIHSPLDLCSDELILIYITDVLGSVIPMRVLESDSIGSVKLRIQTCKGFVVKRQKLVFEGREMARNDSLVKDYGVCDGNVLHLVLKLSDLCHINVSTTCGMEFEVHVDKHRNVGYLKHSIAVEREAFVGLKGNELFCNGDKLENNRLIRDIGKENSNAVMHLVLEKSSKVLTKPIERDAELSVVAANCDETTEVVDDLKESPKDSRKAARRKVLLEPITVNSRVKLPQSLCGMINSALDGLVKGQQPIRSSEGTGGAYYMPDGSGNKYVAVFKPIDEEPLAVNNPQGLPLSPNGEGLKRGTVVGGGALREVAAFVLDHPKSGRRSMSNGETGFSGVPPTAMVQCLHNGFHYPNGFDWSSKNIKIGSLQMFVSNFGNCEDLGPQRFPVEEVHKICVFDLRTANADRHSGNILVSREGDDGRIVLTPIDHGYILPEKFEDCTFDWLYWPQARQPFSPETTEYIKSLDAEQDIALVRSYGWEMSLECARTLRISTMLLKKGAERGLSPYTIGSIMCRVNINKESVIEEIVNEAMDSVLPGSSESEFLENVSRLLDIYLDKLSN